MTIPITMPPGQYGAMHITRWSASVASCEATRCRHWASARAVLPRRPPWSMISNEKTLTKHSFYLVFSWQTDAKKLSNIETRQGPSTHVLSATSSDPNPYATSQQVEDISYILSYQTQQMDKNPKVIKLERSPRKPVAHICASSGYPVNSSLPLTVCQCNCSTTGSSAISNQLEAGLIMVRAIKSICKSSLP